MKLKIPFCLALVLSSCSLMHLKGESAETCDPAGHLVLSGHTLYGTTAVFAGGFSGWGYGTVYKVNSDGTGFAILHDFPAPGTNNTDGYIPQGGVIRSGSTLFGAMEQGGAGRCGTLFRVNTHGRGFRVLHAFNGADGGMPLAGLILSGHTLYGVTCGVGDSGGTVFKVQTDGTGFATLHLFTKTGDWPNCTNSDGANPITEPVLVGNTLYGTARRGGRGACGTIFKVNTDGTDFDVLHNFAKWGYDRTWGYTNAEGALPASGFVSSGGVRYGITSAAGMRGGGTLFKINPDGSGFAVMHHFQGSPPNTLTAAGMKLYGTTGSAIFSINADGTGFNSISAPVLSQYGASGLIPSGAILYGTTPSGGSGHGGIVFKINADGTGFTILHSFIEKPLPPSLTD